MKNEIFDVQFLKAQRKKMEVTQQDLASDIGVSQSLINSFECRNRMPSVETLFKLARYFECKMDDFFVENGPVELKLPQTHPWAAMVNDYSI